MTYYDRCQKCGKLKSRNRSQFCRDCAKCGRPRGGKPTYNTCQKCGNPKATNASPCCKVCGNKRESHRNLHSTCVTCGKLKNSNPSPNCRECMTRPKQVVFDQEDVVRLYQECGNGAEVARHFGISRERVRQILKFQYCPTRQEVKECPQCRKPGDNAALCRDCYTEKQRQSRYSACKLCPDCGEPITNRSTYCRDCASARVVSRRGTLEKYQRWVDAYSSGKTAVEIAKAEGVTFCAVTSGFKRLGFVVRPRGWSQCKFTPEQEQEVVALYSTGLSVAAAADHFGVSAATARKVLVRLGVPRRKNRGGRPCVKTQGS